MRLIQILSIILILSVFSYAETTEPQVAQDAFTCDCMPSATNPFAGNKVLIQGDVGSCFDRLFLQWDLSDLEPGVTINKAEMHLYCYNLSGSTHGEMLYLRLLEEWDETTINDNNRPSYTTDKQVVTNWATPGSWHIFEITEFVQDWCDGTYPNYGLTGHCQNTTSACDRFFYSSNCDNPALGPKLIVDYTPAVAVEQESIGVIKATIR